MPRKPPAEPIDHHYDIPKLNRVFVWVGVAMTVIFIGMVVEDYARPWKRIQRAFFRLDARQTRQAALAAREKARGEERVRLTAELRAAREQMQAHARDLAKAQKGLDELFPRVYLADQQAKFTRASYDAQLYRYEDAVAKGSRGAAKERKRLDEMRKELDDKVLAHAKVKQDQTKLQEQVKTITARRDEVRTSIEKLTQDFRLNTEKLRGLQQDTIFKLRNAPILDMVNPSLRVQQVMLPEHLTNVNFMRIPKVDRCATCHIASDRKGFENAKNSIFRSHPRQDLMVGSESPHPYGLFGCTPCHGGRDRATSFWSAGHSPENPDEEARWHEDWNWKFDRFNNTPVLPMEYTEAGCYRCHSGETNFPDAPKLDGGIKMVESLGCWGCHRIEGLEKQGIPRVGPSLEKVAAKVPREWTTRWVMKPEAFRANTKMPTFFYQENFVNVSGDKPPTAAQKSMNAEGRLENDAMVNAIVSYIYAKSQPAAVPAVSGRGNVARGETLLAERGCFGCHVNDPAARRDLVGTYRQFGPNLAGIGSKASRDWIYHWIRDPKAWSAKTKMPNLRLTHEDALDIAQYLAAQAAPKDFGGIALPKTDEATLDKMALYFQMETKTVFDAKADLAKMDLHAKEVYTGGKLISFYGCFACHDIPGFADAKPIGTELTEEGSKTVHRLDFGFQHIPHTRHDWFHTKLMNPRFFDRDRARGWEERYRMPNFRLEKWEADRLVTAVLGFQEKNATPAALKHLDPAEEAIERGRRVVKNNNCLGCHIIEGQGGSFRSLVSDVSLAPPIIQGQGAKVQSDWLFSFLKSPRTGQIRPWLEVHMPTFDFTEQELNDLTRYFASLDRATYPFLLADYKADPRTLAAGRKTFELLKCAQCHPRNLEEMNRPGVDRATLAPNLQMSASRLRHDWINDWIRRPDEWMPGTRMPTNFPKGDDGKRYSPLAGMFDAPAFAADRAEFARILGGDDAAKSFLADPDAVTKALRDYVWSLGSPAAAAPSAPSPEAVRAFGKPEPPPAAPASGR